MTAPSEGPLSTRLPGTWLLESRIDRTAARSATDPLLGEDPVALLVYDRSGHFTAQFMKRDRSFPRSRRRPARRTTPAPRAADDAYFGTYRVDDAQGTVAQELLGSALARQRVGMVLTRAMSVRGDTTRW